MLGTLFSTPRPEPSHLLPAAGSALVIALALPVFLVSGWSLAGWGLAAVLWLGVHALLFKSIGLLVVLFTALATDRGLAVAAALTYGLAYTFELGLSLAFYFGAAQHRVGQR